MGTKIRIISCKTKKEAKLTVMMPVDVENKGSVCSSYVLLWPPQTSQPVYALYPENYE